MARVKKAIRLTSKVNQRLHDTEHKYPDSVGVVDHVYSHNHGVMTGRVKVLGKSFNVKYSEFQGGWVYDSRLPLAKRN